MDLTSASKKFVWRSILRIGLTMVVMSRSLAATSWSMGVNRKKFSRLTSVISMLRSLPNNLSNSRAVYSPPKPPPRMRIFVLDCGIIGCTVSSLSAGRNVSFRALRYAQDRRREKSFFFASALRRRERCRREIHAETLTPHGHGTILQEIDARR